MAFPIRTLESLEKEPLFLPTCRRDKGLLGRPLGAPRLNSKIALGVTSNCISKDSSDSFQCMPVCWMSTAIVSVATIK